MIEFRKKSKMETRVKTNERMLKSEREDERMAEFWKKY